MKRKIAIVVHGRFHAFDLANSLLGRGFDVHLFTNYPKWAVARFGFPKALVHSCWKHGVTSRALAKLGGVLPASATERWLHESFGRWAANEVSRERWDCAFCFSGVAEELFETLGGSSAGRWLVRASSHIRVQAELLRQEQQRAGVAIERPSEWMIQREEREYRLADVIVTVSSFAKETFRRSDVFDRVISIPLGVSREAFRPTATAIEARQLRIRNGSKLRVLFVGTKSFQKGLVDLGQIATRLAGRFEFRLVGASERGAIPLLNELKSVVENTPKVPQANLPAIYEWGDLFIFPTIQDGFPLVLTQASASGLPILATTNCGASDFVREGKSGWILPVRMPDAFIERLNWCDGHRAELASMVERIHREFKPQTWDDVALDYENALERFVPASAVAGPRVHA